MLVKGGPGGWQREVKYSAESTIACRIYSASQYGDVIMTAMASQTAGVSIVQAQIKENTKALRHWPLWGVIIFAPFSPMHERG